MLPMQRLGNAVFAAALLAVALSSLQTAGMASTAGAVLSRAACRSPRRSALLAICLAGSPPERSPPSQGGLCRADGGRGAGSCTHSDSSRRCGRRAGREQAVPGELLLQRRQEAAAPTQPSRDPRMAPVQPGAELKIIAPCAPWVAHRGGATAVAWGCVRVGNMQVRADCRRLH
jgi:hypothetical protein